MVGRRIIRLPASGVLRDLRRGLVKPAHVTWLPSQAAEATARAQPMALMAEAIAGLGPVATGPEAAWEQEQPQKTDNTHWSRRGYCHGRCLGNARASFTPRSSMLR